MDEKYIKRDFFDLFDDSYEYNYDLIRQEGVSKNTMFDYIVSSITTPYMKHMTGRKIAIALQDYTKDDPEFDDREFEEIIKEWLKEHDGSFKDVGDFPDELLIFCEEEEDYWIFWNNRGNRSLFGRVDKDRCDSLEMFMEKCIESIQNNDRYSGVYMYLGEIKEIIEEL